MNTQQPLAAHETVDLHEILNLKTLSLFKSKMMQGVVFDQELKALLQKDVTQTIQDIADLQAIYARAPIQ